MSDFDRFFIFFPITRFHILPWTVYFIYFITYTAHLLDAYYYNPTPNLHSFIQKKRIYITSFLFPIIISFGRILLICLVTLVLDKIFVFVQRTRVNCLILN